MTTERDPIDRAQLEIRGLTHEDAAIVCRFTCGDDDLDDFLRTDAMRLQEQNVVRTFLAFYKSTLVGYIALLADAVELKPSERKKLALHFRDHPIVPALKIARIGVSATFRTLHRGAGEALMFFAYSEALALAEHIGIRLLTLDAYPGSIGFYERHGFVRNQAKTHEAKAHPSMRFDLFAPTIPEWVKSWSDPLRSAGVEGA